FMANHNDSTEQNTPAPPPWEGEEPSGETSAWGSTPEAPAPETHPPASAPSFEREPGARSFTLASLVGKVLDESYQVDEMIGQGAMGAVFRGRQLRLRRTVALKVPKPEQCARPDFLGRFEREALAMARVQHENIAQIHDVFISPQPNAPSF